MFLSQPPDGSHQDVTSRILGKILILPKMVLWLHGEQQDLFTLRSTCSGDTQHIFMVNIEFCAFMWLQKAVLCTFLSQPLIFTRSQQSKNDDMVRITKHRTTMAYKSVIEFIMRNEINRGYKMLKLIFFKSCSNISELYLESTYLINCQSNLLQSLETTYFFL